MKRTRERAKYAAAAYAERRGVLPNPFPRIIGPNAMQYLQEVVDSGLTVDMMGRFEKEFAAALGVKHCIGSPGCTPALHMLAAAFDFEPGSEIIVSPVTDYGTIHGLIRENYIPVFADTEPGTVNLSAATVEPLITDRTRAILVVHMTGLIPDMDAINALARRDGLVVYEDACQAVFSTYRGRNAGTLSQAAGFSFDAEKTMGSDTGGCVVTDDDELAERVRFIGQSRGGVMEPLFGRKHIAPGHAFRMTQCTAAICLAQLEVIREQVAHRDEMVRLLTRLVAEIPGLTPLPIPDHQEVYSCWMFAFTMDPGAFTCTNDEFAQELEEVISYVGTGRYYLMPAACTFLDEHARRGVYPYSIPPASRSYRYSADSCPTARDFLDRMIRWSTFCEKYTPQDCELAAKTLRQVAARNRA